MRYHLLAAIGLFGIFSSLCRCQSPAAEGRNLISNGGFEDGLTGWVADPKHSLAQGVNVAHSGKSCLVGEVSKPNQALSLRQSVPVRTGCQYRFQIAARATNGTKLVLFGTFLGEKGKKNIATWDNLKPAWQELSAPIQVAQPGTLELQIVAPSSYNAPPGKIWIDDVALIESTLPPTTSVSNDVGFNDEPALARAEDGSFYVAWLSFRDGADTLQIARYGLPEKGFKQLGQWQIAGGQGTYLLGVKAVPAADRVAIVYAAEQQRTWDICVAFCGVEGPAAPVNITKDAAVDINPSAVWREGALWIAWESNRNNVHQIWLTAVRDGKAGMVQKWGQAPRRDASSADLLGRDSEPVPVSEPYGKAAPPQLVSQPEVNAYNPSLAILQSGVVCVAWHSFVDDNYDVYLRRCNSGGQWEKEVRITRAPTIDRHATLAARGDELWLAYENAQVAQYHMGATNYRRLIVGKIDGDKLLVPKDYRHAPLWGRCESPGMAFDRSGRLWMAYLRPRLPRAGWDTWITCYDGSRWREPAPLFTQKGMDRRPGLVIDGDRAIVAAQTDDMPTGWNDVDNTATAKSHVELAVVPLEPATQNSAMQLEPLAEPDEDFEAAALHVQRGEHLATPAIEYQGERLKLFYGDLHHHSDISVCNRCGDQSVEEGYQHMRDICRLDFACSTDHCYNINPYLWSYLGKLARVNEQPDRFLTFLSEEWTSSFKEADAVHPYGFYGHRNLIFGDTYFPRWWNSRNRQTPAEVWEELWKLNADFIHIPHQLADTGNVPTDWNFTNERAQPVAEIFQTRGSYEYHGTPRQAQRTTPPGYFIQDAWARGIVIGVIAAPDHGGGYGKACVYAPELSRKAILDALRKRRCYATTAAKIVLDVRVNDHLMGEAVATPASGPVTVKIHSVCPGEIDRVEVCRNNRFIYLSRPQGKQCDLTFVDREPLSERSYYYVRVIQKDEEIAWSSPVWFGKE